MVPCDVSPHLFVCACASVCSESRGLSQRAADVTGAAERLEGMSQSHMNHRPRGLIHTHTSEERGKGGVVGGGNRKHAIDSLCGEGAL